MFGRRAIIRYMIKIPLDVVWKVAIVVLLGIIAFYCYRIDNDVKSFGSATPTPIGCGIYNSPAQRVTSNICLRPQ